MSQDLAQNPEARLAALGLVLPPAPKPVAAYIPFRRSGNLLFVSGQIPMRSGQLVHKGLVGTDVSIEQAQECARQCCLNGLAVIRDALGSLDAVRQFVRLGVFVACPADFTDHPKVGNGASELLVEIFGDRGRHARAAVGSSSLPFGSPVEVEFLVEAAG
jgi:enamine deaminase RidA (YjgF/YER057c/UK114 family)